MGEAGELGAGFVAAGAAALPARPGVYAFRDGAGHLLYVGSSRDLRRRVRSYFAPHHAPASKEARIARLAVRVCWWTFPSVLEALVHEARAIRGERPHFNRRLKQIGRHCWVRLDLADPFPRLEVTRTLAEGPWRYLGPFPGGRHLAVTLDLVADALGLRTCAGRLAPDPSARACLRLDLGQCAGPCVGRVRAGAYGREIARALVVLGSADGAPARGTQARCLPGPLPARVAAALAALRAAARGFAMVVVVRSAGEPGHRLLAIAGGRLRAAASAVDGATLRGAFDRIAAVLAEPQPCLVAREDLDEVRIVTAWMASPEGRAAAVDLGRLGRAAAWRRVLDLAGPGPLFEAATGS